MEQPLFEIETKKLLALCECLSACVEEHKMIVTPEQGLTVLSTNPTHAFMIYATVPCTVLCPKTIEIGIDVTEILASFQQPCPGLWVRVSLEGGKVNIKSESISLTQEAYDIAAFETYANPKLKSVCNFMVGAEYLLKELERFDQIDADKLFIHHTDGAVVFFTAKDFFPALVTRHGFQVSGAEGTMSVYNISLLMRILRCIVQANKHCPSNPLRFSYADGYPCEIELSDTKMQIRFLLAPSLEV